MSASYAGYRVEVGDGVLAGYGEDRDVGEVLSVSNGVILIAWEGGANKTRIDTRSCCVDDDSVTVYASLDAARAAFNKEHEAGEIR